MARPTSSQNAYQGASRSYDELKVIRVPAIGAMKFRGTSAGKDQRFVNGFFDVLTDPETQKKQYFFTKRPGYTQTNGIQPSGGAATARGCYSWRGSKYSVYGTKIYANSTDLGVTLSTSTGLCAFAETRPGVTTQYLSVNDGTFLYVIDTSNNVIVLNNVVITSSSVANPSVITTTTPHGLATGNRVYIVGHSGSTPSINATVYSITVTGASTFTIPVNVTGGGTGGSLGVFPSPNTGDLMYADSYLWTMLPNGSIWNCDSDNPLSWNTADFIFTEQYNGSGVGLAHQNNIIIAFTDRATAMFYDNANAVGSPFNLYEQAVQQYGCASGRSIMSQEQYVIWVSNSNDGGYAVIRMDGIGAFKPISTPPIERLLRAEGTSISACYANCFRVAGKFFYLLSLVSANRTFCYDILEDLWTEWEVAAGGAVWPIVDSCQHLNTLLVQHSTNGWLYSLDEGTYQDDTTNFTVLWRTSRLDFDTSMRKFVRACDLVCDISSSTANALLQYSDDDFVTLSTARTLDMSQPHCYSMNLGNFRRRSWQVSYAGNIPSRWEALEFRIRLAQQ